MKKTTSFLSLAEYMLMQDCKRKEHTPEQAYDYLYWNTLDSPRNFHSVQSVFSEGLHVPETLGATRPISQEVEDIDTNIEGSRVFSIAKEQSALPSSSEEFKQLETKKRRMVKKFWEIGRPYQLRRSEFITLWGALILTKQQKPLTVSAISHITNHHTRNTHIQLNSLVRSELVIKTFRENCRQYYRVLPAGVTAFKRVFALCLSIDWEAI